MNKENLIKILEQLKEIRTETKSKVDDATLWDGAIRIHNSEQIEFHRQGKNDFTTSFQKPNSAPATQSQKNLLKRIGYKGDISKLTKIEAIGEIDKRIG